MPGQALRGWILFWTGFVVAGCFHLSLIPPLRAGVVALGVLTLVGIVSARVTPLTLLPRFAILLYSLPFSVLVGYLFDREFMWIFTSHGSRIIQDHFLIRQMITVGLVGLLGLLAGFDVARLRAAGKPAEPYDPRPSPALALLPYAAVLALSFTFSWISSPRETIFSATWGQAATVSQQINFPAAYMVSYILILVAFLDLERDGVAHRRRLKGAGLVVTALAIIVGLQLLRGEREASGLVVGLLALYVTSPLGRSLASGWGSVANYVRTARGRMRRLFIPLAVIVPVFVAIGAARFIVPGAAGGLDPVQIFQIGLSHNTWTAVLWTNLSATWEYNQEVLRYRLGETYLGYLLSIPPGFITAAVGLERPAAAALNLAAENPAGLSSGGLHVTVAPFKNFGAFGVLLVMLLYGWLIGWIDRLNRQRDLLGRLVWGSTFTAGFFWFWYGDMPFMRAMMIAVLAYFFYRILLSIRLRAELVELSLEAERP